MNVDDAREYARMKHGQQRRRGALAFDHVRDVVANLEGFGVTDTVVFCSGWLHDIMEDTNTNYDDIRDGFGREVADCVAALSKDNRLPRDGRERQYASQLRRAPWQAQVVKIADILANLQDLADSDGSPAKLEKKALRLRSYAQAVRGGITRDRLPGIRSAGRRLDVLLDACGLEPMGLGAAKPA